MSFRLSIQDYRHHHFGDPRPAKVFKYFATREEAEAAYRAARAAGPDRNVIMCVTETRRQKLPIVERQVDFGFEVANGPRRLTE
jgi:hypothetical protein